MEKAKTIVILVLSILVALIARDNWKGAGIISIAKAQGQLPASTKILTNASVATMVMDNGDRCYLLNHRRDTNNPNALPLGISCTKAEVAP